MTHRPIACSDPTWTLETLISLLLQINDQARPYVQDFLHLVDASNRFGLTIIGSKTEIQVTKILSCTRRDHKRDVDTMKELEPEKDTVERLRGLVVCHIYYDHIARMDCGRYPFHAAAWSH